MTKDEQKRLDNFNKVSEELINQGFSTNEVSMGILKANIITLIFMFPIMYIILNLYDYLHTLGDIIYLFIEPKRLILIAIALIVLVVAHELLHGLTWSVFTPNGFINISFGIVWKYLSPYCTCKVPLKRNQYVLGVLMPLMVLGILPTIIGLGIRNISLTLLGTIFIIAAGGDIIMAFMILNYKKNKNELLVYDHPTKMGVRFFER